MDLERRFPNRKFLLVFHNGGVTRREPELLKLIKGCKFKTVNDFDPTVARGSFKNILFFFTKSVGWSLRVFLRALGLAAYANNDLQFRKLQPWLISLRGHYSNRYISKEVSDRISNELFADISISGYIISVGEVAVHFRLGDLVDLDSKKPISAERIAQGIAKSRLEIEEGRKILVLSDSPKLAIERLATCTQNIEFEAIDVPPRETIALLVEVITFVGSPSKISEWVAVFRGNSDQPRIVWLPIEMKAQMSKILGSGVEIHYF